MKSYILCSALAYSFLIITPTYGIHQRTLQHRNADNEQELAEDSLAEIISAHIQRLNVRGLLSQMPSLIGNAIVATSITRMIGDPTITLTERALDPILPMANAGKPAFIIGQGQNFLISSRISNPIGAQIIASPPARSIEQMLAQAAIQAGTGYVVNWAISALLKEWHKGTIKKTKMMIPDQDISGIISDKKKLADFVNDSTRQKPITFTSVGARDVRGTFSRKICNVEDADNYHCLIYQKNAALEVLEALPTKYYDDSVCDNQILLLKSHYTNDECERTYPRLYGFSDAIHKLKRAVLEKHITLFEAPLSNMTHFTYND